jgi:DNA polymerase-3 subunit gamma/tau
VTLALYRKYRPRTFAEVIGQEHVTEPLSQALRSGRLHHAYLFSGPRGCGKTSSARILARSLNCEQGPTPEPCGACGSCRSLMNDGAGSIDVIEIDAASHGGVDDARDLREKAFFAPASSRYKIYVIDEAHMVSSAGFNALLKLVEEPPDYVKFIFATTEPEKVLGTIKSRTHHYPFRLIPPAVLRPYLQQLTEAEGVHVEPAVFPLVVRAGGGSARDTLSVLDQLIAGAGAEGVTYSRAVSLLGVTDVALIDEMCDAIAAGDGATAYKTIDRVAEAGHDARRFASDLLERFRDLIILQQVPDAVSKGLIDGPADQLDAMSAQATRLGPATLSRCADIVHNGLVDMRGTTAPRLLLELITARMLLPGADDSAGALLQRLERMERRLTLSDDSSVRAQPEPATSGAPAPATNGTAEASDPGAKPGGGISAARAAAAAAGRRAPAAGSPPPSAASGEEAQVSAPAEASPVSAPPGSGSPTWPRSAAAQHAAPARAMGDGYDPEPPDIYDDEPYPDDFDRDEPAAQTAPQARRPEPAGVLPDAPAEPEETAAPGQLSAAAIREVWPEIIADVGRKSKKIAALASGATVRDLEGQTVVLTFRFPAHAKMVATEPGLITDALYEALGGRWQIRCDVSGEAGGVAPSPGGQARRPASASPAPAQTRSAQNTAPTRQRETSPQATASAPPSNDDDDWPEPTRPGGLAASEAGPTNAVDDVNGSSGNSAGTAGQMDEVTATGIEDSVTGMSARPAGLARSALAAGGKVQAFTGSNGAADGDDGQGPAASAGSGIGDSSAAAAPGIGSNPANAVAPRNAATRPASAESANKPAPSSGIAAARAAAAGARNLTAAKPGTRPDNGAPPANGTTPAPGAQATSTKGTKPDTWSDGPPADEPPYDPDYDAPVRDRKAAAYEGFDPGDEPLDEVIDEKTARQSSEQQAMQLLQDMFGAEKIGEA